MAAHLWLEDENSCHSQKDDDQDLFVFGYACKIFRNDEKALYVDKGRHLIPWMGDDSLMIDRYDGRGHLFDLSQCDADNVDKKELSEEEKTLEKLCDEERYLELNTDIAEKTVYEEEEWKRYQEALQSGYNAVGFSYEQPETSQDIYHQDEHHSEDEKPFIPPSCLNIPSDLILPSTNKINAVIEKTAKFIAEHGTQMEIVLKAKQALNSQFDFLDYNSSLNSYYKFMVKAIKSGKYIPRNEPNDVNNHDSQEDNEHHDHHEHGYLHKSLAFQVQPSKSVKIPVVSINDTPYGQLVKSIRKHHKEENLPEPGVDFQALTPSFALQQQHHEDEHHQKDEQFYHQQMMPTVKGENHSYHDSSIIDKPSSVEIHQLLTEKNPSVSNQPNTIIPPPPDIQPIIDRMAMYVAKNGSEFEMVVQSKNDVRFQFLNDWHVHYKYYDFKKKMHQQILLKEKEEKEEAQVAMLNKSVSFSIKTRNKESEPVTQLKKPLFDYGSSDDNNDSDSEKEKSSSSTPSSDQTSNKLEESNICENDLFQDENKKAVEGKLMNKLAGAARDKLAQTSKEKQIQAERKRKAAMFISLLKGKSEQKTDSGNQVPKVVIDYGHGKKDEKKSPNHRDTSKSITPPLTFNKSRRSSSRSPKRKLFHSRKNESRLRSPSLRDSPSRHSRTPRTSPNRRRSRTRNSHRSRSRTPPRLSPSRKSRKHEISPSSRRQTSRNSPKRSHSPVRHGSKSDSRLTNVMKSRSKNDRSSHSNDKKSSTSCEDKSLCYKDVRTSPPENNKSLNYQKEKKKTPVKNSDYDNQPDLIELTHLTNIVIKKEKTDSGFDKAQCNSSSAVPSDNIKCSDNRTSETNENNSVASDTQEDEDDDDDDVKIVEVPVEPLETVQLVDLTYLSSDSNSDKKQISSKKHSRKRRSRSPSKSSRKHRRSLSKSRRKPSPYRRKSRSKSPSNLRYHSGSNSIKGKHSKRHRSKSKSRSPKRKKDKSCSPKRKKSKSKSLDRKISRDSSKSRSYIRRRSRSKSPKRKKLRSPSLSSNRKRSHSRSASPRRKGSKAKKKHKSRSRSPKSHKSKKTKEKEKMFEATMTEVKTPSCNKGSGKMVSDDISSSRSQLNLPQSNEDSLDAFDSESSNLFPKHNLLNKVRAMLKASRDVVKSDDETT